MNIFFPLIPTLEISLICILLSASRDVYFDKKWYASWVVYCKKHVRAKPQEKHIISRTQGFYVIFKSPLFVILWYAFMNRLTV